MQENKNTIANLPTVRRLPAYLRLLHKYSQAGRDLVSSTHLADDLGLEPIQVRKDLAMTGVVGKPKIGFYIPSLISAIEHFIGWDNFTDAFMIGVGNLGAALMRYEGFNRYGLNIIAGFDSDEAKIGTEIEGKEILAIDKLSDLAKRLHVHIAVLCVPAAVAQETAEKIYSAGIRAIWNFTPEALRLPGGAIIENVDLAPSLAILSRKIAVGRADFPDAVESQF